MALFRFLYQGKEDLFGELSLQVVQRKNEVFRPGNDLLLSFCLPVEFEILPSQTGGCPLQPFRREEEEPGITFNVVQQGEAIFKTQGKVQFRTGHFRIFPQACHFFFDLFGLQIALLQISLHGIEYFIIQNRFSQRIEKCPVNTLCRSLGLGIEKTNFPDFIELGHDPYSLLFSRHEDVQNLSSCGEFPFDGDSGYSEISEAAQPSLQLGQFNGVTRTQVKNLGRQVAWIWKRGQESSQGCDNQSGLPG